MFRASLYPSPGAYQLQQQPLVYRRNVVVAVLLVVVGLVGPTTTNSTATSTDTSKHVVVLTIYIYIYIYSICLSGY